MTGAEDAWQLSQLNAKIGEPGSGAKRYAAAMYFYGQGRLSVQMLEVYRRCIRQDREDPVDLAAFEGIATASDLYP